MEQQLGLQRGYFFCSEVPYLKKKSMLLYWYNTTACALFYCSNPSAGTYSIYFLQIWSFDQKASYVLAFQRRNKMADCSMKHFILFLLSNQYILLRLATSCGNISAASHLFKCIFITWKKIVHHFVTPPLEISLWHYLLNINAIQGTLLFFCFVLFSPFDADVEVGKFLI